MKKKLKPIYVHDQLSPFVNISSKDSLLNSENYQYLLNSLILFNERSEYDFTVSIKTKGFYNNKDYMWKKFNSYKKKISEIVSIINLGSKYTQIYTNKYKPIKEVYLINDDNINPKNRFFNIFLKIKKDNFRCKLKVSDNNLYIYKMPYPKDLNLKFLIKSHNYDEYDEGIKLYKKNSKKIEKVLFSFIDNELSNYSKKNFINLSKIKVENGIYNVYKIFYDRKIKFKKPHDKDKPFRHSIGLGLVKEKSK